MAQTRRRGTASADPQPTPQGFVSEDTFRGALAQLGQAQQIGGRELEIALAGVGQSMAISQQGALQQHQLSGELQARLLSAFDNIRTLQDEIAKYKRENAEIEDRDKQRKAAMEARKQELDAKERQLGDLFKIAGPIVERAVGVGGMFLAAKMGFPMVGGFPGADGGMPGAPPGLGAAPGGMPGAPGPGYTPPPPSKNQIGPWKQCLMQLLASLDESGDAILRSVLVEATVAYPDSSGALARLAPYFDKDPDLLRAFMIFTAAAREQAPAQSASA